jgi:2-polyprenyl-6-methoxyphenol hydroxylase-like FAD-dependent oxidoreductase
VEAIVVGAGVAGLTAANAVRCTGSEVVVLEARDPGLRAASRALAKSIERLSIGAVPPRGLA